MVDVFESRCFSKKDQFEPNILNISSQRCLHFSFTLYLNSATIFLRSISCSPRLTHPLILSHSLFFNLFFPLPHSLNCPSTDSKSQHIPCFSLSFHLFSLYIHLYLSPFIKPADSELVWECVSLWVCVRALLWIQVEMFCGGWQPPHVYYCGFSAWGSLATTLIGFCYIRISNFFSRENAEITAT